MALVVASVERYRYERSPHSKEEGRKTQIIYVMTQPGTQSIQSFELL